MAETVDPIQLYAQLNPVSAELLSELADGPEREQTLAKIVARRDTLVRRPRRQLAVALIVAVAVAVPALAFSGVLGSLFGLTNHGTPVTQDDQAVVSAVRMITGETPTSVVRLASREGWTFYAAQTTSDVCYFDEAPPNSTSDGIPNRSGVSGGSCKNAAGESNFPSPPRPVFNMSHYSGPTQSGDVSVTTLAGVAVDAVASVQVLALSDCHVVAAAQVIDNVYIADNLPIVPEAMIVARDANGTAIWHQAVGAAIQPAPASNSCGIG